MLDRLQQPVHAASLVAFRVAFGAVMVWEAYRYGSKGWIERYYLDPAFLFSYPGFDWIAPLPGLGMYAMFGLLALGGVGVVLGAEYRFSAALLFVTTAYVFLLAPGHYLNHFYLLVLLAGLLAIVPAHHAYSVDAWTKRRRARRRGADRPSTTVPTWSVWLFRAQLGIVYTYAGIAKLNADWFRGEPIGTWLANRADYPVLGPVFAEPWAGVAFAWGGLVLDLFALPFLLWRRTRLAAYLVLVVFHLMNAWIFTIGVFPWAMIALTLIYFRPEWPVALTRRLRRIGAEVPALLAPANLTAPRPTPRWLLAGMAAFLVVQLLLPLRHWAIPGDVAWTEEGHRFAWRMKLRSKTVDEARFFVVDRATNSAEVVDPDEVLASWQAASMTKRPDMIREFAHYLAEQATLEGSDVAVYADIVASLNGRPEARLIDPGVDLAAEPRTLGPAPWILPRTSAAAQHTAPLAADRWLGPPMQATPMQATPMQTTSIGTTSMETTSMGATPAE
ncbi:MAG: HTTM domain-containing protein [Bacteroidota bacterium]